jgi:hypothetical protein
MLKELQMKSRVHNVGVVVLACALIAMTVGCGSNNSRDIRAKPITAQPNKDTENRQDPGAAAKEEPLDQHHTPTAQSEDVEVAPEAVSADAQQSQEELSAQPAAGAAAGDSEQAGAAEASATESSADSMDNSGFTAESSSAGEEVIVAADGTATATDGNHACSGVIGQVGAVVIGNLFSIFTTQDSGVTDAFVDVATDVVSETDAVNCAGSLLN